MSDVLSRLRDGLAGRYRVEREIGAGGMATVYLAHDERHGRRVAIKVLRPELAAAVGAERFLLEIKVTAALQHPHILPLYDSGEIRPGGGSGIVYYVMPYVEGESLRARLDRLKQLPLREALDIARAVASALDHAHQRGVVHRDIKPENILLAGEARDGVSGMQALVADFGIAIAVESAGSHRLTDSGLSIGTPQYMSPEQASAERNLGPASDVYSLGVVLYEMLSGEPPFTGPTAQAVVARVMSDVPAPLRRRRATVSPRVESAVMRALAKSPADRPKSAAQFADELQSDELPVVHAGTAGGASRGRIATLLPWGLVAALAVVSGALLTRGRSPAGNTGAAAVGAAATHFAIAMPESTTANDWRLGVALSPDGGAIAFVASNAQGQDQIYVKRTDEPNINALAGTVGARSPFFSSDGRRLGFFQRNAIKAVSLASGSISIVADSNGGTGARWTSEGFILLGSTAGIRRVTETGATDVMTRVDTASRELRHFAPQTLPGSRALIYSVVVLDSSGVSYRVMVRPDSGSAARVLVNGADIAEYVGDGRIVYQRRSDLFVADFDLGTFMVSNERRLLGGVAPRTRFYTGAPWAVSGNMLVYGSATGLARGLVWVDRAGGRQPLAAPPRAFHGVALSPDGHRVVTLVNENNRTDLWIYDLAQDVLTQSQFSRNGSTIGVTWGPTAGLLTSVSSEGAAGRTVIAIHRADGTGTPEPLLSSASFLWPAAWTRDGRSLVLMDAGDITVVDRRNAGTRRPVVNNKDANELGGRLSPDERWLAYFSNATGRQELYVTKFPDGGQGERVTRNGAREAIWSRDGTELFFRSENGRQMLSVPIRPGGASIAGTPVVLFDGDFFAFGGPGYLNYDLSLDGKRFLMLQRAGTESGHLNVVLGWDKAMRGTTLP